MITLEELNLHHYSVTDEIQGNLNTLLKAINVVRTAYGKPMVVTSGLRSISQQDALIKAGKSTAIHSWHLVGAAVDIQDKYGALAKWTHANEAILEKAGLWCEATESTNGWVHYQIFPPKSGHRFFIP